MSRRIFKTLLITLGLFTIGSFFMFYVAGRGKAKRIAAKATRNPDFFKELHTYDDFAAMQGAPLSDKFNDVQSVKMVYDLRDRVLYFVNSSKYRYHINFCNEVLGDNSGIDIFNTLNYGSSSHRLYILANLNYYVQSHMYGIEFTSDDEVNGDQVKTIFDAIYAHSYLKDSLKVLVGGGNMVALDNAGKLTVPKVYVTDIYRNQQYQRLNDGYAYGILRKIENTGDNFTAVSPQDIIIIKGTPTNVPVCAGIITDMYQTPLSHINVLCHNRNIPSAVLTTIWNDASLNAYVSKPVRISVTEDSVQITPASREDFEQYKLTHDGQKKIKLHTDLSVQHLLAVKDFGVQQKDIVGNKAAGLGELARIAKKQKTLFSVPEGAFAIPFYYYRQHISSPAISKEINDLLTNSLYRSDAEAAKQQLKKIRKAIKEQPLDAGLLRDVYAMIQAGNAGKSFRFRSSSNAEDMEGFNAAGLYDSKTGIVDDTAKSVERAIKSVWASTWNEEAYRERIWSGIDQQTINMAILVHRNFPDESANGVAITKNLYRSGFPGFTINVQAGEISVVSPPDSVTCEQFVCIDGNDVNPLNHDISADYLTYSNINHGKPVLTPEQVTQLYKALKAVKGHYYWTVAGDSRPEFTDYALDIEFKFDKNGKLYLKQARPYR